MKQSGRFILFDDFIEFQNWLNGLTVNRTFKGISVPIGLVQNHHTYQPDYPEFRQLPDYFHWLQSMEDFQMKEEGFEMCAQNFTTFPDGKIAACRPLDKAPAGILGANYNGICIEHLGNFDVDDMTDDHKTTVVRINAALCKKFNLVPNHNTVVYHHWWDLVTGKRTNGTGQVKTCPGVKFFGGNTVDACDANFIPLIQKTLSSQ